MLEYYTQRASEGGLIVSEATPISIAADGSGRPACIRTNRLRVGEESRTKFMRNAGTCSPNTGTRGAPRMWTRRTAVRFYNNIQDRGDCQTPRKSYKTSHFGGLGCGLEIRPIRRRSCISQCNPRASIFSMACSCTMRTCIRAPTGPDKGIGGLTTANKRRGQGAAGLIARQIRSRQALSNAAIFVRMTPKKINPPQTAALPRSKWILNPYS